MSDDENYMQVKTDNLQYLIKSKMPIYRNLEIAICDKEDKPRQYCIIEMEIFHDLGLLCDNLYKLFVKPECYNKAGETIIHRDIISHGKQKIINFIGCNMNYITFICRNNRWYLQYGCESHIEELWRMIDYFDSIQENEIIIIKKFRNYICNRNQKYIKNSYDINFQYY
jgi:hypothetical protein